MRFAWSSLSFWCLLSASRIQPGLQLQKKNSSATISYIISQLSALSPSSIRSLSWQYSSIEKYGLSSSKPSSLSSTSPINMPSIRQPRTKERNLLRLSIRRPKKLWKIWSKVTRKADQSFGPMNKIRQTLNYQLNTKLPTSTELKHPRKVQELP